MSMWLIASLDHDFEIFIGFSSASSPSSSYLSSFPLKSEFCQERVSNNISLGLVCYRWRTRVESWVEAHRESADTGTRHFEKVHWAFWPYYEHQKGTMLEFTICTAPSPRDDSRDWRTLWGRNPRPKCCSTYRFEGKLYCGGVKAYHPLSSQTLAQQSRICY